MNHTINLSTKKITDFTPEDTIYIRNNKDDRKPVLLCQFIKYESKNATVQGKIICNPMDERENYETGKVMSARLSDCALYGNATGEEGRAYYRWFDSSLYAMHPMEEHKVFENDVHIKKHPSYGLARFSRISGGYRHLFGSSIQSQQTVIFSISRATHDRSLSNDWYHAGQELIEIEMSQNQFAELITSFNMGQGIPVTIKHINHDRYPNPPFLSKADLFSKEFKKKMFNFGVDMKKMVEQASDILINKANIGKGDREIISQSIESLVSHITSTIPFVSEQFQESMEKTVLEAKSEIEAFIENKIRNTGLEALGYNKEENAPLIDNQ